MNINNLELDTLVNQYGQIDLSYVRYGSEVSALLLPMNQRNLTEKVKSAQSNEVSLSLCLSLSITSGGDFKGKPLSSLNGQHLREVI